MLRLNGEIINETARKSLVAATLEFLPPVPKEAIKSPALPFSSLPSILLLPSIPSLFWPLLFWSYSLDRSNFLCFHAMNSYVNNRTFTDWHIPSQLRFNRHPPMCDSCQLVQKSARAKKKKSFWRHFTRSSSGMLSNPLLELKK
jgi:hypothetical protein